MLAVHGMKRRWAEATIRDGLVRDSAAWFVLPAGTADIRFERTLAAALFLALAPTTRARLAAMTDPGAYDEFFGEVEGLMPALLLFSDEPTGLEEWHRYVWPGPPGPGTTGAYTKVARARRQVGFTGRRVQVVEVDRVMMMQTEVVADKARFPPGAITELARVVADAPEPAFPAADSGDKLRQVCASLAAGLATRLCPRGDKQTLAGGQASAQP
jgi:hypothetical protein